MKLADTLKRTAPLGLLVVAAIFSACSHRDSKENTARPVARIQVAEATTDSVVIYKKLPGLIESATVTNVVAQVNGKILTQNYKGGSYVNKGDVLFTIEPTTYVNDVERATANLATAQSQRDYYTQQLAAMRRAFEADAVSKMQVAQAENNLKQAEASVREAQASLSTARDNLSHCTVRANSSGYISDSRIDAGNYVSGEGQPVTLATIYDNTNLQATFSVSDADYEQLIGRQGGLDSEVYRNVPLQFREPMANSYTANLYYVSPSVSASTASLTLIGTLTNRNNELRNGMYVSVSLPYGVDPHAVLVKDASLGSDQSGYYLYTVDADNTVRQTPVKVGPIFRDSLRVVTSGIAPGDKYVTKALLKVRSGETIDPILTK